MLLSITDILHLTPNANKEIADGVAKWLNVYGSQFGLNTQRRIAFFLSQAAHETDDFRSLKEYASGQQYEGRKDLGNVNKGDGVKYKGRGIFQITGRNNYRNYSRAMFGDDRLLTQPELLETPQYAVLSALQFWKDHNLNAIADKPDTWRGQYGSHTGLTPVQYITYAINGGTNGLNDRTSLFSKAMSLFVSNPLNQILSWFTFLIIIYFVFRK